MGQYSQYDALIVGAGLWGSVLAERFATLHGWRVLVIDRRNHTGGNCHSVVDDVSGVECHVYGTHIFHTKIERVWQYVNAFTGFNNYRHKVYTSYKGTLYPMPIALPTINSYYGMNLKPFEAEAFIAAEAAKEHITNPQNLEEKAISLIGRPLYEAFIEGYTRKQWEKDPRELPAAIITRLPVRTNYNTDYFNDPWQGLPLAGYHGLFAKLLANPLIRVQLGVEYHAIAPLLPPTCKVFYSGPIDGFFQYSLGELEWRTLRLEQQGVPYADYQGTAVINEADMSVAYTRTHEYKHLHPEREHSAPASVIVREYSKAFVRGDEPYYPVNTPQNAALLTAYQQKAKAECPHVTFGGRLGGYVYTDMDITIHNALTLAETVHSSV